MLLITQHFAPEVGGIQQVMKWMHRCFGEHCVVVAPFSRDTSMEDRIVRRGFYKFFGFLPSLWFFRQLVRSKEIDVVICGHMKQSIEAYFLSLLTGTPYIVSVYGKELLVFQKNPILRWLFSYFLARSACVVGCSANTVEIAKAFMQNDNFTAYEVLHPVCDTPSKIDKATLELVREKYELGDTKMIFSVSRLEERKGIDTVIRVMPQILESVPDAVFVVASTGPYEESLKQLASSILQDRKDSVRFVGRVSDEEKAALFTLCDVYAMPSRVVNDEDIEGFGIVLLEANSYGKPVVAGHSGGMPDAVVDGETGFLVDPYKVSEVGDRISALLSDSALANQLGNIGKARVGETFTLRSFCQKLKSILQGNL